MNRIRGGSGLGDNLYVQAASRYIMNERKEFLEIATPFPDLFRSFSGRCSVIPFTKARAKYVAHYTTRKRMPDTSQFEDVCINLGIPTSTELVLDWPYKETKIGLMLLQAAKGKRILTVQMPRMPMGRPDNFGIELLPELAPLQNALDMLKEEHDLFTVMVGRGKPLYQLNNIDLDMSNKTNVRELLEISASTDLFYGQVSSIIPLAESFKKPVLTTFARRGLKSGNWFISCITPKKVNHRESSKSIVDDSSEEEVISTCKTML